ncbi:hypothetical protein B296_00010703 [Ensete ventricosum]|uniref:Uncharacterized protein n=1 Tax=Ensete ventricosum TaxID=4639 RepID=A0A427AI51_ENSVE|nr:hypothetical protein B296_00010703 [Ensete ventricosum]
MIKRSQESVNDMDPFTLTLLRSSKRNFSNISAIPALSYTPQVLFLRCLTKQETTKRTKGSQTQPYPIRFHIIRNGNFKKRDTKKEHPGRSMEAIEPGESNRESICDPFLSSFLPLSPPNPSTPEKSFTIFRWSGSHGVVFRYTESEWRADRSHARLERLLDPSRLFPFARLRGSTSARLRPN